LGRHPVGRLAAHVPAAPKGRAAPAGDGR
jgi:hypothetical protein